MFCKNCGNQIEDGSVFCPNCGKSTNEKTSTGFNIDLGKLKNIDINKAKDAVLDKASKIDTEKLKNVNLTEHKNKIIIGAVAAIVLIFLIFKVDIFGFRPGAITAKGAIKETFEAIEKGDFEKLVEYTNLEAFLEDSYDKYGRGERKSTFIKDAMEDYEDSLEDDFDDVKDIKVKKIDKLKKTKTYYKADVEVVIELLDDTEKEDFEMKVVKQDGKWVVDFDTLDLY